MRRKCDREKDGDLCYREMGWIETYMNSPEVRKAWGADDHVDFQSCNMDVNKGFLFQGDGMHDSSAVLALFLGESGEQQVKRHLPGARLSAVNLAEVVARLGAHGMSGDETRRNILALGISILPFDEDQATEIPRAYVVPADGLGKGEKEATEIVEWLNKKVAQHKKLRGGVRFVDEIPKSVSGKILRRVLKVKAQEELKASKAKL